MSLRSRLYIFPAFALAMCDNYSSGHYSFGKAVFIDPDYHMKKMKQFTDLQKSKKRPLTPKAKKAREKSKRAKQARKIQRKNRSLQLKRFANQNQSEHKDLLKYTVGKIAVCKK